MTKRERQYHQFTKLKNKYGFSRSALSKSKSFFDPVIVGSQFSNYGIFIPDDIARNSDGTPKEVKPEFQITTHE